MDQSVELLGNALQINEQYHPAHHLIGSISINLRGNLIKRNTICIEQFNCSHIIKAICALLAESYFEVCEYAKAFECLNQSLSLGYDGLTVRLLAATLYHLKQVEPMRELCIKYAHAIQTDSQVMLYMGLLELDEKCYVKALDWLELAKGCASEALFEIEANLAYCRYLLRLDPDLLLEIVNLALAEQSESAFYFALNLLETLGELDKAEQLLAQAYSSHHQSVRLQLLSAKVMTRRKQFSAALAVLKLLPAQANQELELDVAYQKIAIYEAQSDYQQASSVIKNIDAQFSVAQQLAVLQQETARAALDADRFQLELSGHERPLVFIIGFPRSGTTLLESRLAPLPKVKILEETNAAKQFYSDLLKQAGAQNVMSFIQQLAPQQRLALANDYLNRLNDYVPLQADDIIVDKMPLNGLYILPLLSLFPKAKVILMERHPMDLCLSSLKQRMINLFSVASFAQSYDCYFTLLETIKPTCSQFILTIKYEQLVTDFKTVFGSVLEHTAISENGIIEGVKPTAPFMFNTPSYHQVSQPLYTKSVSAYLNYQPFFNFKEPLLVEWCQRLGYSTD
ncbi:MAG: sulfotransferase [Rheinheimera sp.]|nr:sulfotransferase [Rheinheimera sp.]